MILDPTSERGPSGEGEGSAAPTEGGFLSLDLVRGGPDTRVPESTHGVHVAVVRPDGDVVLACGDPGRMTLIRSAAKPFQALPLVEAGLFPRDGAGPEALALCTGSHSGEPRHVEGVRALLGATGGREEELACGPHPPMGEEAAAELARGGGRPLAIHNNCSGKHAGMMMLARQMGASVDGYHRAGHPVQEEMARAVARWTGVGRDRLVEAVDGCGVVCFGVPLQSLAGAYARLLEASGAGPGAPAEVVSAMTAHPWAVAGTGRLCTDLMEAGDGRLLAKVGAQGVYGAALTGPEGTLGIALKVEDGHLRAAEMALLHVLEELDVDRRVGSSGLLGRVRQGHPREEKNTRGDPVARWVAHTDARREEAW